MDGFREPGIRAVSLSEPKIDRRKRYPDELVASVKAAAWLGIPRKVIAKATGVPLWAVKGWGRKKPHLHHNPRKAVRPDPQFAKRFASIFRP